MKKTALFLAGLIPVGASAITLVLIENIIVHTWQGCPFFKDCHHSILIEWWELPLAIIIVHNITIAIVDDNRRAKNHEGPIDDGL